MRLKQEKIVVLLVMFVVMSPLLFGGLFNHVPPGTVLTPNPVYANFEKDPRIPTTTNLGTPLDTVVTDPNTIKFLPPTSVPPTTFVPNPSVDYPWRVNHTWGANYFSEYADWGASVMITSNRFDGYYEYFESLESMYWWGDLYDDNDELASINTTLGSPTNLNETLYFSDAYDGSVDMYYNVSDRGNTKQWFVLNQPLRDPALWLEGNISLDPLFSDDFQLNCGSPCIDSGNPNAFYNDIDGSMNDMGYTGCPLVRAGVSHRGPLNGKPPLMSQRPYP